MRRLAQLISLLGMLSAAALCSQCQYIGGFAGHEIVDPGLGGSGGQGTGGQGGTGEDCALVRAPLPPARASAGTDESFTLAVRSIELNEGLDKTIGLDLDGACTCSGAQTCACASVPTCQRPPVILSDDQWQNCDEPGGIDANSRQLFAVVQAFEGFLSSELISASMFTGSGSILFDVRQYNGQANDESVFVGVYTTGSFITAECNDTGPVWNGEDAWPIARESTFAPLLTCGGEPDPTVFDAFGYVTDNQLVARLDKVTLALQLNPMNPMSILRLRVHDAVAVVPLQRSPEGEWSTEGAILTGQWRLADVFQSLSSLDQLTQRVQLCDGELSSTQSTVCASADIATSKQPGDNCDAVSFGIEFNAQQARFGNTIDLPPPDTCPELLALDCESPVQ